MPNPMLHGLNCSQLVVHGLIFGRLNGRKNDALLWSALCMRWGCCMLCFAHTQYLAWFWLHLRFRFLLGVVLLHFSCVHRYANTYVNVFAYPSHSTNCYGSTSPSAPAPYTHPLVYHTTPTITAPSTFDVCAVPPPPPPPLSLGPSATNAPSATTSPALPVSSRTCNEAGSSSGSGSSSSSGSGSGGYRMITYQPTTHRLLVWDVTPCGDPRLQPHLYPSKPYAVLSGHSDAVLNLALLPDGRVVSKSWKEMRIWNVNRAKCEAVLPLPKAEASYATCDTPSQLWVPMHSSGAVLTSAANSCAASAVLC
jgi:hypothetical protein